jgi:hypothetical protein
VDGTGNLFITDAGNYRIRKVSPSGIITTVAGNGTHGFSGDGGPATSAQLSGPLGMAVDGTSNLFIADAGNYRIRKVSPSGIITTVAGNGNYGDSGDGGPATSAQLSDPYSVAVDGAGNVFIADTDSSRIRRVSPSGIITTVAGNGSYGYSGDGGPATSAQLDSPRGVTVDGVSNLFIADTYNSRIRKVSPSGIITTVAGNGIYGVSGDGGLATSAQLSYPSSVAVDGVGNLFIADGGAIRKVSSSGLITTIATLGLYASAAVDAAGNLFIADSGNNDVSRVSPSGVITTVASNGSYGYLGDGGQATSAQFFQPAGVAVDAAGRVYISDGGNNAIRLLTPSAVASVAIVTTSPLAQAVAGTAYSQTLSASGGTPPYVWSLSSGALPPALSLGAAGVLSGTATTPGTYTFTLQVKDSANSDASAPFSLTITAATAPAVSLTTIQNAAGYSSGSIAPGEIVVLYGSGMGPAQLAEFHLSGAGIVGSTLAGTQVLFNSIPAPLVYTSAIQVAAVVPYEVSGASAGLQVSYQGQLSNTLTVQLGASAPGIFTADASGRGPSAALNSTALP